MRKTWILGLVVFAAMVSVAWHEKTDAMPWRKLDKKLGGHELVGKVNEILAEAKDRNAPILLYVGDALCVRCHAMKDGAFKDGQILKLGVEKFICLQNESNSKDPTNDLGAMLYGQLQANVSARTPIFIFVSPEGKEMEKYRYVKEAALSAGEFGDLLQKVVRESGNSVSVSDYKKFIEAIQKAEESVKEGSYKVALGKLAPIAQSSVKKAGIVQRAKEKVEEILKIGDGLLSEAKQLEAEKKWIEAHQKYQFVDKEFGTSKAGKDARDAVARLLKDPEAGPAIKAEKK